MPTTIPQLRQSKKPISSQKYRDLMTILQWVPNDYKACFQLLPHGEDAGDFPDEDSTWWEGLLDPSGGFNHVFKGILCRVLRESSRVK
ncbi:hypothetical protein J6590_090174 [Homalodisca vitripennis]|nr:hypothetical protein J6590_090174 [Homalodisca vitripennis]